MMFCSQHLTPSNVPPIGRTPAPAPFPQPSVPTISSIQVSINDTSNNHPSSLPNVPLNLSPSTLPTCQPSKPPHSSFIIDSTTTCSTIEPTTPALNSDIPFYVGQQFPSIESYTNFVNFYAQQNNYKLNYKNTTNSHSNVPWNGTYQRFSCKRSGKPHVRKT